MSRIKTCKLSGKEKVLGTVKKDIRGPITNKFLEKDSTVNSASYCQVLRQNSPYLLNDPRDFCL